MEKFYGQFDPPVDRVIFERYFPDKNIRGVFVECGAYDGQSESCCKFFEESMGWRGFNIEPVPWVFEWLVENRPLARNLNFALSDRDGTATFTAYNHPVLGERFGNGSLEHTEAHLKWLEDNNCTPVKVDVPLSTWRDFVERERISQVDLLVLDVEGHELRVIEGMKGCPVMPDVFCVEAGHLGIDAIRQSLAELGYTYDITSFVNLFFVKTEKLGLFASRRADHLQGRLDHLSAALAQQSETIDALRREAGHAAQAIHATQVDHLSAALVQSETIDALRREAGHAAQAIHATQLAQAERQEGLMSGRIVSLLEEAKALLEEAKTRNQVYEDTVSSLRAANAQLAARADEAEATLGEIRRSKAWALLTAYRRLWRQSP